VNCKDGRSRTVLATAASFTASCAGEHLVLLYDITERKLSEKALEESEAKYRLLFENMKEGFSLHEIITDETGRAIDFRFLDANSAYKIHTGLNPVDVVGRTIRDILPDGDAGMIENYGRVALTGEPLTFEYYSKAFDRYLRVSAFSPQPRRFATIFEDITGRKTSESALQEASKENLNLLAELQHRAKNSFALISSLIILTSEKDLSPETKSAFEDLDARVRSISELYSLLYSSGSFTDVRLDEYLTRVSGGMAGLTLNISLTTDFDDITVSAKKAAPIGLIVTELLTNVFKYAFPDGRGGGIVIGLKKCAGGAALEVRDDGCGLPPGFVLAGNTGMGLRLVSGLARQIGGSFEIGGGASGTTCVVRFPMETNGAD
jgi:PAS domain S-box-containing protein